MTPRIVETFIISFAKIVECKNPLQRYVIGSFEQKLAVILKYILPDKLFMKILEDHYKINKNS